MRLLKIICYLLSSLFFILNSSSSSNRTKKSLQSDSYYINDYSKPFHTYSWLVAHNAYSNDNIFSNQYGLSIKEQLKFGVRGFMLDIYDYNNSIYLCHKSCYLSNYGKFFEALSYSILPFLRDNPREIVTLFLEDHSSREVLEKELKKVFALDEMIFNPQTWSGYPNWPSLDELIKKNQRLFIITDNKNNSGYYEFDNKEIHLLFGQDITVENYWSLGDTYLSHNYNCVSRWADIPLSTKKSSIFYNEWDRLVVMNQFHGIPFYPHSETDNKFRALYQREQKYCYPETQRTPNFVAVDNVSSGETKQYLQWLNSGGLLFFKSLSFDPEDLVCGLSNQASIYTDLAKIGCDQYLRAIKISKLKQGTIIRLFDKSHQFINSEYAEIKIKNNLETNEDLKIDLENFDFENSYYKYSYFGNKPGKKKFQKITLVLP